MKFLILFALVAASHGKFLDKSVKVSESWENLVYGGIRAPGYGISTLSQPMIIGGSNANPGEFPHQISMQVVQGSSRFHICGGSIIGADRIATAAHCCDGQNAANIRVVAGAQNMQITEASQQVASVSRIVMHPSYNGNTINNDACKLMLSAPLTLNDRVATISMCTSTPTSGSCTATGWGTTSTSGTVVPPNLQKVNLQVVPKATCQTKYALVNTITDAMLCAGTVAGEGGCNGDSGGPIVCGSCLAGATSWGMQPCAQARYPTVYANAATLNSFYSS